MVFVMDEESFSGSIEDQRVCPFAEEMDDIAKSADSILEVMASTS
jgi:hypothetical protein